MIFFKKTPDDFRNRRTLTNDLLHTNFVLKRFADNLIKTKDKTDFLSKNRERVSQIYIDRSKRPVENFFELSSQFYQNKINQILNDAEIKGFYYFDAPEREAFFNNLTCLIANIPAMFFTKIERAIAKFFFSKYPILAEVGINTERVSFEEAFEKRTERICAITDNHVKLLAEDQNHKLKSAVEESIYKKAGFYQYSWHNQMDIYVVGNPHGLYPVGTNVHENHWSREGKIFRWDMPPSDGHPGRAAGCRCFSRTVKKGG